LVRSRSAGRASSRPGTDVRPHRRPRRGAAVAVLRRGVAPRYERRLDEELPRRQGGEGTVGLGRSPGQGFGAPARAAGVPQKVRR
ncbi:hypothetical protein THAOC_08556, partial [Thalassiosira oceanica]